MIFFSHGTLLCRRKSDDFSPTSFQSWSGPVGSLVAAVRVAASYCSADCDFRSSVEVHNSEYFVVI